MKVITWNIGEDERDKEGKLDIKSYEYIADIINNNDVDVACFQEAITTSSYLPKISEYLKEKTKLKYSSEYELSDSHINIGSKMGVVICSKYKIESSDTFLLDNPNLIYKASEEKTYYSHDKGFLISYINDFTIITGHCLPFYAFKKEPIDYIEIYKKADDKFINEYNKNNKIILCGDFNYDDVNLLFPKMMKNCKDLINCTTRKDKQLDHFIVDKNIKVISSNIMDNYFDHKLGIFEID